MVHTLPDDSDVKDEIHALPNDSGLSLDLPPSSNHDLRGTISGSTLEWPPSRREYWSDSPKGSSSSFPCGQTPELKSHDSHDALAKANESVDSLNADQCYNSSHGIASSVHKRDSPHSISSCESKCHDSESPFSGYMGCARAY